MPPAYRLQSVSVHNYKAFAEGAVLDLAPLTLLFGRNASGKSVAARLPLLVTEALGQPGNEGIPLSANGLTFGASLLDMLHGRLPGIVEIRAKMKGENKTYNVVARIGPDIGGLARRPRQRIHEWTMSEGGDQIDLRWLREPKDSYELNGDPNLRGEVQFQGIVPVRLNGTLPPRLGRSAFPLFEQMFTLPKVSHLGPFREPALRYYALSEVPPEGVGLRGELAVSLLGYHETAGQRGVLKVVSKWFEDHLGLELQLAEVGVDESDLGVVLRVRPVGRSAWTNIQDAGTGTMQVLPYVVQHAVALAAEPNAESPGVIVCEEPEAHLHPAAQAGLADLAIQTAQLGRASVVLETHSETLLLRVRRRIAEGQLSPDDVAFYWVDDEGGTTRLRRLTVDREGWVTDWPDGIFAEAAAEARAISRANRDSKGERP